MNFLNDHWHDFVGLFLILLGIATVKVAPSLSMPLVTLGAGALRLQSSPASVVVNNSKGDQTK
jgi:hypothetical protein